MHALPDLQYYICRHNQSVTSQTEEREEARSSGRNVPAVTKEVY